MTPRKHPLQCLYFTSLEELFDAIDRADRSYLHVCYKSWAIIRCHWSVTSVILACILQVWSNNPMPLIGQILDICLYFTSLEQLFEAIDWSDHRYLLVFHKSWTIIRCRWSVRSLVFACVLHVLSNYPMPLISQAIHICLYFTSLEQWFDAIDKSDHCNLLEF